jgi:hypothetical protein
VLFVIFPSFQIEGEDYDSDEFEGGETTFFSQPKHKTARAETYSHDTRAFEDDKSDDDGGDEDDQSSGIGQSQVNILHSVDLSGAFTPRGKLTYRGPKLVTLSNKRSIAVTVSSATIEGDELTNFNKLVELGGLYRIQVPSNVSDPQSPPVMASVRACALAASNFHERMQVYADEHGLIRNVVYFTPVTDCTGSSPKRNSKVQLTTKVKVVFETDGLQVQVEPRTVRPQPQGQSKPGQPAGESEPPQSFIRKMYIVPGVLIMMMMGGNPEEDERRGGRGGEAAGGEGSGVRQRRTVRAAS